MLTLRSLLSASVVGAAALTGVAAVPSTAGAADIDVHVYRPRPVYVAPTRVVTVGPHCVTRRTRVWVGDHYVYRTVRRCY